MAFNVETIHRALASQIQAYLKANGRDTNVNPFPSGILSPPSITVEPDPSGYIPSYFETFGTAGYADINVRLKIEVDAIETESVGIKIASYLSVGTSNGSSVVDAIRSDKTLGGVVDDCLPYDVEWSPDEYWTAYINVRILAKKTGAQP